MKSRCFWRSTAIRITEVVAELLDNAVINRLGDDFDKLPIWEKVKEQFDIATRLEVSFWGMGLRP